MDETSPDQTPQDEAVQAPAPAPAPVAASTPAYGSLLGIILIVAVLVAGAFYIWNKRVATENTVNPENGVRGDTIPFEDSPESSTGSVEGTVDLDMSAQ